MPLHIVRNDLVNMEVDAVVLPANPWLEVGRGTSEALFAAAGEHALAEACDKIGYVDYGHVVMTDGFNLPSKYILHAVVPFWEDNIDAPKQLYNCYVECLERAAKCGFESIAFPLLGSGNFKCPKAEALKIANYAFNKYFELYGFDMDINLVIYDKESLDAASALYEDIDSYIDDRYVEDKTVLIKEKSVVDMFSDEDSYESRTRGFVSRKTISWSEEDVDALSDAVVSYDTKQIITPSGGATLDELMGRTGESFHDAFIRYVNASGLKNSQIYGRANISKALFSKIMCNADYHPKKQTILTLAFALRLSLEDTEYLLMKAGHALTDCSKFDIVCRYFLEKKVYDVLAINEVLFDYDLELLGNTIG